TTPPIKMNWKSNFNRRGAVIKIDHKDRAVLHVRSNMFNESIRISDLIKQQQFVKNYDGNLKMVVELADRALDIPLPNDKPVLGFTKPFTPRNAGAVFQVRMITRSGDITSSDPVVMPLSGGSEKRTLHVYSDTQQQMIPVQVLASRCPVLDYAFDPANPGVLNTPAGKRWQGTLAGGWSYGGALQRTRLPQQSVNASPRWVKDDGKDCLSFDGKTTYCHFPTESIPSHGPFTIQLQIKPTTQKKQYLIHSRNTYPGTVDLVLDEQGVTATYRAQMTYDEAPYFTARSLTAQNPVPLDQWTTITLGYDFEKLTLKVGDAAPVSMPLNRTGWWPLTDFTFGGWGPDSAMYYHGVLRQLRISHFADQAMPR
ncbi:MAG: LamG-like jellyroll fold domain-containing protein, partial [Phycisphaeraceae bacterium JB051]